MTYVVEDWSGIETIYCGGTIIDRGLPGRAERRVNGFLRHDSWSCYAVVETTTQAVAAYAGSRENAHAKAAKLNAADLPPYAATTREQQALHRG